MLRAGWKCYHNALNWNVRFFRKIYFDVKNKNFFFNFRQLFTQLPSTPFVVYCVLVNFILILFPLTFLYAWRISSCLGLFIFLAVMQALEVNQCFICNKKYRDHLRRWLEFIMECLVCIDETVHDSNAIRNSLCRWCKE